MNRKLLSLVAASAVILSACTNPTEEVKEEINRKIEEEVGKAVDSATETARNEAENLLNKGAEEVSNIIGGFLGSESGSSETEVSTGDMLPAELVRCYDGDTVTIRLDVNNDGRTEELSTRLLLINSPEVDSNSPFAHEAGERACQLLQNGNVTVELASGSIYDKYDRLLTYIYADGVSIQETLLREGLARVAYVYPPNTKYLDEYEAAEALARSEKLGIWSIDGYVVGENGFNE